MGSSKKHKEKEKERDPEDRHREHKKHRHKDRDKEKDREREKRKRSRSRERSRTEKESRGKAEKSNAEPRVKKERADTAYEESSGESTSLVCCLPSVHISLLSDARAKIHVKPVLSLHVKVFFNLLFFQNMFGCFLRRHYLVIVLNDTHMASSYVAEPGPKSASGDASLSIEETKYVFVNCLKT